MKRRRVDFRSFDEAARDVTRLWRYGYDRAGNWDLPRMSDHLTRAIEMSLDGFPMRGPRIFSSFLGPFFLRPVVLLTRRIAAGVPAPAALLPPETFDDPQAVDRFLAALGRVRDHSGTFHASPLFGRLSAEQWRQIHLIHISHHLSFLLPRPPAGGRDDPARMANDPRRTTTDEY